jgi:hypothetical protein
VIKALLDGVALSAIRITNRRCPEAQGCAQTYRSADEGTSMLELYERKIYPSRRRAIVSRLLIRQRKDPLPQGEELADDSVVKKVRKGRAVLMMSF